MTTEGRLPTNPQSLRFGGVDDRYLADLAVKTAKLDDLAVSIDKTSDPVWVRTVFARTQNVTIDSTWEGNVFAEATIAVPAWVGQVSCMVVSMFQMSNTSGSTVNQLVRPLIGSTPLNSAEQSVANNESAVVACSGVVSLSAPGTTISLFTGARVNSGTNTSNLIHTTALIVGER